MNIQSKVLLAQSVCVYVCAHADEAPGGCVAGCMNQVVKATIYLLIQSSIRAF